MAAASPSPSALRRFTAWCVQSDWGWWRFDLSWIATTYIGAVQLDKRDAQRWSEPIYYAFLAGAWMLHFTEDVVYWVAKPKVHVEPFNGWRRLHNERYAAIESDVENIYFWHGVMVPAFVVVRPDWITVEHIHQEQNAEVRRIMVERYGLARYLEDSGAQLLHEDEMGQLYRSELPGDEPLVMVKVVNSTAEPDGTFKPYFLRVPPDMRTAREAVAWTFNMSPDEYAKSLVQQT